MKRLALFCALCACLALSCARQQEEQLKTGDLIFVGIPADYTLDEGSMDAAISQATGAADSLNLIHVAIAEVDAEGQAWVIDATIKYGVDRHPLDTFLTQFTLKDGSLPVFEVMRLKDEKPAATAVERAKIFLGTSYAFINNDIVFGSKCMAQCKHVSCDTNLPSWRLCIIGCDLVSVLNIFGGGTEFLWRIYGWSYRRTW